jgi:hypothetical protein
MFFGDTPVSASVGVSPIVYLVWILMFTVTMNNVPCDADQISLSTPPSAAASVPASAPTASNFPAS